MDNARILFAVLVKALRGTRILFAVLVKALKET